MRINRWTVLWCSLVSTCVWPQGDLQDWVGRVQFDYYAADARSLQRDLEALQRVTSGDDLLKRYYLTYGHWKLAETLADKERGSARDAAQTCAKQAEAAVDTIPERITAAQRGRFDTLRAELWALQATCIALDGRLALMPGSKTLTFSGVTERRARERALALAPHNPRVQLLEAIHWQRQANSAAERSDADKKLQAVLALYEVQRPATDDLPDWGEAEAHAWQAQSWLAQGNRVAARNAAERALVLAPDYVWARTLLTRAASGQ